MEILPKDVYEYLANFADDKTIINMLSVNKKFNDPVFFERIFKRKYPLLIPFKTDYETWKEFYLKMIKYISLLEEEYDIPYIPYPKFNPYDFYRDWSHYNERIVIKIAFSIALENGKKAIEYFLEKSGKILTRNELINFGLSESIQIDDIDMVKYFIEKGADLNKALGIAYAIQNEKMEDYLISLGAVRR